MPWGGLTPVVGSQSLIDEVDMLGWMRAKFDQMAASAAEAAAQASAEKQRQAADAEAAAALNDRIAKRFPPDRFFRVPAQEFRRILKLDPNTTYSRIDESVEDWKNILYWFPTPPAHDAERQRQEERFWNMYADKFTVKTERGVFLSTKQDIMDAFAGSEIWIFRGYFAATGVFYNTIMQEYSRLLLKRDICHTEYNAKDTARLGLKQAIGVHYLQAQNELNSFERQIYPAHMEKWGEWFFINIQSAFDKRQKKSTGYGPGSPMTSEVDATDDGLDYNPKM